MFLVAGMICIVTFTGLYIRGTNFFDAKPSKSFSVGASIIFKYSLLSDRFLFTLLN